MSKSEFVNKSLSMSTLQSRKLHGRALLESTDENKGTAFTSEELVAFGLEGLLFLPQSKILESEVRTAVGVATLVFNRKLAGVDGPKDIDSWTSDGMQAPAWWVGGSKIRLEAF